jgi:hypothetical protein
MPPIFFGKNAAGGGGEGGSEAAAPKGSLKKKEEDPPSLLTLGEDHCNLIFSLLCELTRHNTVYGSARHLLGLRQTCNTARRIVDSLPVWTEMLEEMNKMNRYNVSRFGKEKKPFVWLPEAERDETYQRRSDALPDWSKNDPRIRKSWASLTSFGKCAELHAFSRETVKRIQRHLPMLYHGGMDDDVPWPGCGIPSSEGVSPSVAHTLTRIREVYHDIGYTNDISRFQVFFRLAQLNTAMKDLCRKDGPYWYRESGSANSDVVIKETRGSIPLQKAINRFYCCDEGRRDRWSGYQWGTSAHLENLAHKRAASRKLRNFLGEDMCEGIEVLGEARDNIDNIIDNLDDLDEMPSDYMYDEDFPFYSDEEIW